MSLVYAYKTSFGIRILSDTKLTVSETDKAILKKEMNGEEYNNAMKYGVVKTIIYKNKYTISSAGVLENFNHLMEQLTDNNIKRIDEILNIALNINVSSDFETDFIITNEKEIYEIKDGKIIKNTTSWIGDIDAFSKFQKERFIHIGKANYDDSYTKEEINSLREITKNESAFRKVIADPIIDSVGGILVRCTNSFNSNYNYAYLPEYETISGFDSKQIVKPGENIIFYHKVYDGGFQYQVLDSREKFLVYFSQINMGIVYQFGYSSKRLNHLLLPVIIYINYKEFVKKYADMPQSIEVT